MIRELYQKGWTQTAIAKETGFDRKTIRKYLKEDKLPERRANGEKEIMGNFIPLKLWNFKSLLTVKEII